MTANTVGGDFFDYLAASDHQVCLVIADVSGKAMRGAMNAVHADGALRSLAREQDTPSPATLMAKANNTLATSMDSDMNVTMVIALVNTETMVLTLANAAHHAYPLLVRDGEVQPLKARGLPLGMKAGIEYHEETFELQSGDMLVLMTDGIIEARDANGNMYGASDRLQRVIAGFTNEMSPEEMVETLIHDTINYGAGDREDDMTVVLARVDV